MEKLPKDENDFLIYMDKLNEMYEENPKKVHKEVRETLRRLDAIENSGKIMEGVDIDKFILCILIFVIAVIGFLNIEGFPMYLFGLAFFLAGHFVGLYVNVFGLIFLFSHSVTGMCIMIGALVGDIIHNPLMSDNPQNIYIYFGIGIAILIAATLVVILHNLSMNFRERKHVILIPMTLYAIAFAMAGVLPKIIDFIYLI